MWMLKWKGFGRKRSWPNEKYYLRIRLGVLRKTAKPVIQDSQSLSRDSDPGPPEHETGLIITRSWCSVLWFTTALNFACLTRAISEVSWTSLLRQSSVMRPTVLVAASYQHSHEVPYLNLEWILYWIPLPSYIFSIKFNYRYRSLISINLFSKSLSHSSPWCVVHELYILSNNRTNERR
jgi:hypothetical protein